MVLSVCSNPDLLSVMLLVNQIINLLKILVPIGLIIFSSIDLLKSVIATDQEGIAKKKAAIPKRALAAIIIFLIPSVIDLVMIVANDTFEYNSCFTNATKETIKTAYLNRADNAVAKAESTLNKIDYDNASLIVFKLEDSVVKTNYKARLAIVLKTIQEREKNKAIVSKKKSSSVTGNGKLSVVGSYSSSGNGVCKKGVALSSEPDPSAAINCWSYVSSSNFVYPKDPKTGLPLGAWPKNYASIPTKITGYNTYAGTFIFPITPTSSNYHFVYQHTGIDFMANFGTPIYSPADGTLMYSEWGHTKNKGGDETAYTVSVKLSKAVTVQGVSVDIVFLTHMSGIIYRCSSTSNCNRTVKKGELLGFSGNAAGTSTSIGWAPHLHMTLYGSAGYDNGLITTKIEAMYGIPAYCSSYKIQVGG
jgi:murein DD-endopeptidase MepM/ murein hydrolase activator NlpD